MVTVYNNLDTFLVLSEQYSSCPHTCKQVKAHACLTFCCELFIRQFPLQVNSYKDDRFRPNTNNAVTGVTSGARAGKARLVIH